MASLCNAAAAHAATAIPMATRFSIAVLLRRELALPRAAVSRRTEGVEIAGRFNAEIVGIAETFLTTKVTKITEDREVFARRRVLRFLRVLRGSCSEPRRSR